MKNSLLQALAAGIVSFGLLSGCSSGVRTGDNFEMVELPDGSIAYLNKNSAIDFDDDFEPRVVKAEGEVFFSVVSRDDAFTVRTESGSVNVVGTEFNLKATNDQLEVEVEDGIVELTIADETRRIRRGGRGVIVKGRNKIVIGEAEFKFRVWIHDLRVEFKKAGREFKHLPKHAGKESKKFGKKFSKDAKQSKKNK